MSIHPDSLHTAHFSFIDNHGRRIHLRGVNLSGSSKAPFDQPSHVLSKFWETAERGGESFLGQPLDLDDGSADQHLARLRGWGYNLLRFPVTWEALEHAGPKNYDYEYMDYLIRVLRKCKQYGFRVFMDPHQDTWSRFSGGSGAPFWTLPACGINPYNLSSTQAALLHSEWPLPHTADPSTFPAMIWGTNYGRLLSLTLFTLFFAGRSFAPKCIIDDMNIQDYLQSHYIAAFGELADRIRKADDETENERDKLYDSCIIGWDSLNEPAEGLVGWGDLNANPTQQGTTLKKGTNPTPVQSLRLGMGQTQTVETWDFGAFGPKRTGTTTINPKGRKIWAEPDVSITTSSGEELAGERPDGTHPRWGWKRNVDKWPLGTCIWALHGVWDVESGFIIRPDYFKYDQSTGIEVHFLPDFWVPHFTTYTHRIRSAHPNSIAFVQPPVFALPPHVDEEVLKGRCVYTGHYYDGLTLITKHWNWFNADSLGVLRGKYSSPVFAVKFGEKAIRKSLMEQIAMLKSDAEHITTPSSPPSSSDSTPSPPRLPSTIHQYPTIVGEIGVPFDMDNKSSYYDSKHKGDYTNQERALDASLNACDGYNNVGYTIWTYLAKGHSHQWGDGWNGEDLSLWSPEDLRGRRRLGDREDGGKHGSVKMKRELKSESQAGLLAQSRNVSRLTLDTISRPSTPSQRPTPEEGSPVLMNSSSASASTPTLLTSLSKKPSSAAISSKTAVDDEDTGDTARGLVHVENTSTSDTNATTVVDNDHNRGKTKVGSSSSTWDMNDADRDPYDFLTNGARAVRALCRPRAMKVWGEVVDTKFEIEKAEFRCVVRLPHSSSTPDTATPNTIPTSSNADTRDDDDGDGDEVAEMATEIYLPLVHFASQSILERSKAKWDPESERRNRARVEMDSSFKTYDGWKTSSALEGGRRVMEGIEDRDDLLDVEVNVSVGRWKIRGQSLYWWYPHRSSTSAPTGVKQKKREGDVDGGAGDVVIEVKRRGGAIKVRPGGWVDPKSWQPQLRGQGRKEKKKGWCERLCECDCGCVVM